MPIEWLSLSKLIPAGSSAAKSLYDRLVGMSPRLNFDVGSGGIELHVINVRDETIIVERISSAPPLLGFSAGEHLADIVLAVVSQRGHRSERPLAVVSPGSTAAIAVITFDPFSGASPNQTIRVRLHWRTAMRRLFSRSTVTATVRVRDIMDLKSAVER